MARFQHLPIWRTAMDVALLLERAVARFPRTHRYALGAELRRSAQLILGAVMRCARDIDQCVVSGIFEARVQRPAASVAPPSTRSSSCCDC